MMPCKCSEHINQKYTNMLSFLHTYAVQDKSRLKATAMQSSQSAELVHICAKHAITHTRRKQPIGEMDVPGLI